VPKQNTLPINIGSQTQKVTIKLRHEVNVFSSDRKVSTTNFNSLVTSFFHLAEARMSDTQKTVLKLSHQILKFNDLTVTALADLVSRRFSVPYSTVKWNLRSLKEMGLLTSGSSHCKGGRVSLTRAAQMLADYFNKVEQ
jgi:DNA-binding transcriptional ArsR family regulator